MKVAFAGTPDFAVPALRAILRSRHEVCLVVTQPDRGAGRGRKPQPPPVKTLALEYNAPVIQPESINQAEAVQQLKDAQPDVLVVVAYGKILTGRVLRIPPFGCLNIHASLLPRFRGAAPVAHAILRGDSETGVTIQRVVAKVDCGPIFFQRSTAIGPEETAGELYYRLAEMGGEMIVPALDALESATSVEMLQDEVQVTFAPKLTKEDGHIPWQLDARDVCNLIRAMTPWPGAFTFNHGNRLIVISAQTVNLAEHTAPPGMVVRADDELIISAGRGDVRLLKVKPDGGRVMDAREYLRGHPLRVGELLDGD